MLYLEVKRLVELFSVPKGMTKISAISELMEDKDPEDISAETRKLNVFNDKIVYHKIYTYI